VAPSHILSTGLPSERQVRGIVHEISEGFATARNYCTTRSIQHHAGEHEGADPGTCSLRHGGRNEQRRSSSLSSCISGKANHVTLWKVKRDESLGTVGSLATLPISLVFVVRIRHMFLGRAPSQSDVE
jgi:hypothetical protein